MYPGSAASKISARFFSVSPIRATCPARPELGALLVRPDGYVAWATERGHDGLDDAIATWFG